MQASAVRFYLSACQFWQFSREEVENAIPKDSVLYNGCRALLSVSRSLPMRVGIFSVLGMPGANVTSCSIRLPRLRPHEILRAIMVEAGLRQRDLLDIFGSRSIVSEVLSGKRGIIRTQARALAAKRSARVPSSPGDNRCSPVTF